MYPCVSDLAREDLQAERVVRPLSREHLRVVESMAVCRRSVLCVVCRLACVLCVRTQSDSDFSVYYSVLNPRIA